MRKNDKFQKVHEAIDRISAMISDLSMQVKGISEKLNDLDLKQKVMEDETIPSVMREWLFGEDKGDDK